ncbi:MAG: histidinol dehydrogenase [Lautropia sp.]
MATRYLKKASKTAETEAGNARKVVTEMLAAIEAGGEAAVRDYAASLDRWQGEILVPPAEIERRTRDIPDALKRDIDFATAQVRRFALAQRDSIREFSVEVHPGLVTGQRPFSVDHRRRPGVRSGVNAAPGEPV